MDLSLLHDWIMPISNWLNQYLYEIGLSMVSTLLVIYGDKILAIFKQQIGSVRPVLKITLFVLFCAFGFAFITSFLTPVVVSTIQKVDAIWLPFIVVISFYVIGLLAQKRKFI